MRRHVARWLPLLPLLLWGCPDAVAPLGDGGGETGRPDVSSGPVEQTAAQCQDGADNDGDGFTDCADQDCSPHPFCKDLGVLDLARTDQLARDLAAPDLPPVDLASQPVDMPASDSKALDAALPDVPFPDAAVPDLPVPDAALPDTTGPDTGIPCTNHHTCPQKQYCYLGKCQLDPKMPVYHCGKPGSPPGHWCVDALGKKGVEAENPAYACKDACDCGPAHCCVKGVCVKDINDPWKPGGTAILGLSCEAGKDPTYCCEAPECHSGRFAFGGSAADYFRCQSKSQGPRKVCGGSRCFGTACNCGPGEVCADTTTAMNPGQTCLLLSGGSCVPHALAQLFYGFKPSDLLPCCGKGCLKGSPCDAGWVRAGGKVAYQRVTATCGSCGNGKCDEGEYPTTCPTDCTCGDGRCAPGEVGLCKADCDTCGNGKCEPWEFADKAGSYLYTGYCPADCSGCGDGWCPPAEGADSCPKDCVAKRCVDAPMYPELYRACGDGLCGSAKPVGCAETETCLTCPQDCGPCAKAEVVRHPGTWQSELIDGVWGTSATNVFAVGRDATIVRWDGSRWAPMMSGWNARTYSELYRVHGNSPTNVYAVGRGFHVPGGGALLLRFDGQRWRNLSPLTTWQVSWLRSVWVAPSGEVFLVGRGRPTATATYGSVVLRLDNNKLKDLLWLPGKHLYALWGTSKNNIYAVGNTSYRFDGAKWAPLAGIGGKAVWGSGPSDVFVVGSKIHHWDGKAWSAVSAGASLEGVWGSSPSHVVAVGAANKKAAVLRFDGKTWTTTVPGVCRHLSSVWTASPKEIFAGVSFPDPDCYGAIRHDGKGWSLDSGVTRATLEDVWGSSATDVYVVGEHVDQFGAKGNMLHFDGKTWTRGEAGKYGLKGIWGVSATQVFVVGPGVWLYNGKSWSQLLNTKSQNNIWGSSPSNIFVVRGGAIRRFDGKTWHTQTGPPSLYSVWGTSPSDVYAVGGKSIARFDGATWKVTSAPTGVSLVDVWASGPTSIFAIGYKNKNGVVLYSNGNGLWQVVNTSVDLVDYAYSIWGASSTEVYVLSIRAGANQNYSAFARYDGTAWKPMRTDLRRASSGSYACPLLFGMRGIPGGDLYVVGDDEAIIRITP